MSTGSILSILAYPQYGYHLVCHTGLGLVHYSYLSVGSLHHNPFPNHNHILDPPAYPNRTHKAQHPLSLVRRFTSVSSAHFRLQICVSLANNPFTAITIRRTRFTVRQARSISIFGSFTILRPQKYQHLLAAILHPLSDHLNPPKNSLFLIHQPPPTPITITIAASKVGLTVEKSASFKNDGNVTWYKHVCGFPHPRTYSPEYKAS